MTHSLWLTYADAGAAVWLSSLTRACWQGGLSILAVGGVCRLFPRLSAQARCRLWWLACLKMVVGLFWMTPPALPLLPAPRPVCVWKPSRYVAAGLLAVSRLASSANQAVSRLRHSANRPQSWGESGGYNSMLPGILTNFPYPLFDVQPQKTVARVHINVRDVPLEGRYYVDRAAEAPVTTAALPTPAPPNAPPTRPSTALALLAVWALIVLVRGVGALRPFWGTRRLARRAAPLQDDVVLAEAASLGRALGLRRLPVLRESPTTVGPLITGLLRPVVLLPPQSAARLSSPELRMALAHELAHAQRGDLRLALVPALAQTLFFFHPLVWWAGREYAVTREEACDVEALRVTGASAAAYGRLLLKFATARSVAGATAALGAAFGYRTLERRLKMLQNGLPISRRRLRMALPLLLVPAVVCVMPWRVTAQNPRPAPKPKFTASNTGRVDAVRARNTAEHLKEQALRLARKSAAERARVLQVLAANRAAIQGRRMADQRINDLVVNQTSGWHRRVVANGHSCIECHRNSAPAWSVVKGWNTKSALSDSNWIRIAQLDLLASDPFLGRSVSLDLKDSDLRGALKRLFGQAQVNYVLALGAADASPVTTTVKAASLSAAVKQVLVASGAFPTLMETVQGDVVVVSPTHSPRAPFDAVGTNVTLKMEQASLHDALEALFASVHASFTLEHGAKGLGTVTASLNDVPFNVALESLLHSSGSSLTYQVENGVYRIH